MSRRTRIVAGVLGALFLATCVAAVVLYLRAGEIVKRRAQRLARERYGLALTVDRAQVSTSGVALGGVELRLPGVDGFYVRLAEIELEGSPYALVTRRLAGVSRIRVRGGEVHLRATESVLDALVALRRDVGSPGSPAETTRGTRRVPIEARELSLELLDEQGMLARLLDVGVDLEGDALVGAAASVELGDERGDFVRLLGARAQMRRDERWRLAELTVDEAHARWALALGDVASASEVRIVRRLRESLARVRASLGRGHDDPEPLDTGSRLDRLTTRDLRVGITEADVATGEGETAERLSLHEVGMRRIDATRIGLEGRGEGRGGIETRWNLELDPEALRAEGTLRARRLPLSLVGPLLPDLPWEPSMPGVVSLDVELVAEALERITARGSIAFEGVALASPRLAAEPIRDLAMRIEGEGTLLPTERRFVLGTARLISGGVTATWQGRVELAPSVFRVEGSLRLPETDCDRVVHAIPADVLGPLTGFQLEGRMSGRLDVALDLAMLDRTRLDIAVDDRCAFVRAPREAELERFEQPFHHEVLEPDGSLFAMDTGPGTPRWASFGAISPHLVEAVISHEDAAFYRHGGFAPWAIRDALVRNLREGRYVVGASTITMQLAKNLFLHREKTLIRKVQEVLLTWWLERSLSKERILELYLNVIEYGPGIYGIRAASHYYFACAPSQLSPVAAAFLANILPAPKRYGVPPSGALSEGMRGRLERFLRHMAGQGRLDAATLEAALQELSTFRFRAGASGATFETSPGEDEPAELDAPADESTGWIDSLGAP